MNPNAIAIDLDYGTRWTHVGYIASEFASICTSSQCHSRYYKCICSAHQGRVDFLRMEFYPKIWIFNYNRRGGWLGECEVQIRECLSVC